MRARLILWLVAVPLTLATALGGVAPAANASSPKSMTVGPQSLPLTLLSTMALQDGDVLTSWSSAGLTINVAAQPGSVVSLIPATGNAGQSSTEVTVAPPPNASGSTSLAPAPSLQVNQAAVQQALGGDGSSAPNPPVATPARAKARAAAFTPPFNTSCTTVNNNSSGESWDSCLNQTWLHTGSASCGCWYSSNQIESSVYQSTNPKYGLWDLSKIEDYYCYCNGDTYHRDGEWGPNSTHYGPSSGDFTLSAGYAGFSASVSQSLGSSTRLDPDYPNTTANAAFGSIWSSSNGTSGEWDSADSVAIVNTGVGSPGDATLHQAVTITSY